MISKTLEFGKEVVNVNVMTLKFYSRTYIKSVLCTDWNFGTLPKLCNTTMNKTYSFPSRQVERTDKESQMIIQTLLTSWKISF